MDTLEEGVEEVEDIFDAELFVDKRLISII